MFAIRRGSGFVKATHRLSGAHAKSWISHASDWLTSVIAFDSTSRNCSRFFLSDQAMCLASGDHCGEYL